MKTPISRTTAHIRPLQLELLRKLSERTGKPVAEYIREGVDMALEQHEERQLKLPLVYR